ncbi:MAG: hypothetical protein HY900_30865 [Deltaproteobacteria bacterium]|nr:hypothetical protein [Deltaproteobacteria bacterium]
MRPAAREWFHNDFGVAEANERIEYWFHRGYVIFSDRYTRSTHLRVVEEPETSRRIVPALSSVPADERAPGEHRPVRSPTGRAARVPAKVATVGRRTAGARDRPAL